MTHAILHYGALISLQTLKAFNIKTADNLEFSNSFASSEVSLIGFPLSLSHHPVLMFRALSMARSIACTATSSANWAVTSLTASFVCCPRAYTNPNASC